MAIMSQVVLEELRTIVGEEHVWEAEPSDAIDAVQPQFVVEPASVAEAAEVLKLANRTGLAVTPRGEGSVLDWGNPPVRLDLILSTKRLNRIVEHAPGDLIVRVEAGVCLRDLLKVLDSSARQMLALDTPDFRDTLGGIVATNAAGIFRLRYGTVRDLLIGITVVLSDGTVAKAGGKVVKNVAGYDLGKLFTGSFGTLGLIVEAIFRLHPIPPSRMLVMVDVPTPEAAAAARQAILDSPLVPSALEIRWSNLEHKLLALFEGPEPIVATHVQQAARLFEPYGDVFIPSEDEAADQERESRRFPWQAYRERFSPYVGIKMNSLPSELPTVLRTVPTVAEQFGLEWRINGRAGNAILFAELVSRNHDLDALTQAVGELRDYAIRSGGTLVMLKAPVEVKRMIDVWGPVGDALPLMRRVKAQFDPMGTMNPGRFVGGI
jgi:glycolate oxidase FAD binding subunit